MISRRNAVMLIWSAAVGSILESARSPLWARSGRVVPGQDAPAPTLAYGAPTSAERRAIVDEMRARAAGLEARFEARVAAGDFAMPYRLFRPSAPGLHPLVVYLHGSGGLGNDNLRQLATGNFFGTRVWALPEHQSRFPCFILAPQTDRGWAQYGPPAPGDSVAQVVRGLGDGNRAVLALIDRLAAELPIDQKRLYVTGQSMGGLGVWNLLEHRPTLFAAAVICCGSVGVERLDGVASVPLWNFHGDADATVPVAVSRERIARLREAGGRPLHTEYPGVGHNVWEWAYTEPALLPWVFSQSRR